MNAKRLRPYNIINETACFDKESILKKISNPKNPKIWDFFGFGFWIFWIFGFGFQNPKPNPKYPKKFWIPVSVFV